MNALSSILAKVDWINAAAGIAIGGLLTTLRVGWKTLLRRHPLKLLFDDLADDSKPLAVFVREMVSADGKYYSPLPSGGMATWQNFPVVGRTDVEVATDAVATLASAGRTTKPTWRQVATQSDDWNNPCVCVGGSFRVDQVLKLCEPHLVGYIAPDTFTIPDGPTFKADVTDFGLVAPLRHPETGVSCLVLFGMGMAGTAAAGFFLQARAIDLARLYGSNPFAVVLRVGWHDGPASATPVFMSATQNLLSSVFHPIVWSRYRRFLKHGPVVS